jgi:hypothetical protein
MKSKFSSLSAVFLSRKYTETIHCHDTDLWLCYEDDVYTVELQCNQYGLKYEVNLWHPPYVVTCMEIFHIKGGVLSLPLEFSS